MPKANPLSQGIKQHSTASKKKSTLVEMPAAAKTSAARAGRVLVGGHFAPAVQIQLKVLAAENQTTIQSLLAEFINLGFGKYGKPEIAEVSVTTDRSE